MNVPALLLADSNLGRETAYVISTVTNVHTACKGWWGGSGDRMLIKQRFHSKVNIYERGLALWPSG